jgi:hypothetical protein
MTWVLLGAAFCAIVVIAAVLSRPRKARFSFEDREDHVALQVVRHLGSDDGSLMTMTFLREASRLRLVSDYRRFLIDARHLTLADEASFWLLIGGLGPLLFSEAKIAFVCPQRKQLGKRLRAASLAEAFPSERAALTWLRLPEPAHPCTLDKEWVDSLLLPGRRARSAPPLRKAA